VHAGHHELRSHDRGRAADAAGSVDPDHGLAGRTQRVGQVELGHDDALEHVRRLADDDGVDVAPVQTGVDQRLLRRFADEAGHRDVVAGGDVPGLADPDDRSALCTHD
jgi:hypothetical protein